jgi:hypothetical protein
MAKIFKTTFKVRRGLAEVWAQHGDRVILAEGEPGYELDTHRLKIGDGKNVWNKLPYVGGESAVAPEMSDYITKDQLEELVENLIKSSNEVNKIKILEDGTMEVNSLNVSKLT